MEKIRITYKNAYVDVSINDVMMNIINGTFSRLYFDKIQPNGLENDAVNNLEHMLLEAFVATWLYENDKEREVK